MGSTQDKMAIKKNGVRMILDARGVNESMIFYLKGKQCVSEGKVAHTNLPEDKKYMEIDNKE